jgi:hypothetical protein
MASGVEFAELEEAVLGACRVETDWPARIGAGIYAGVDFAILNPAVADVIPSDLESEAERDERYEAVIGRLTGFLQAEAPIGRRLPGSTDAALIGGVFGLVGDYLRLGRTDRLAELKPDLVLLVLLPYLGFAEAQSWANRMEPGD